MGFKCDVAGLRGSILRIVIAFGSYGNKGTAFQLRSSDKADILEGKSSIADCRGHDKVNTL